MSRSLNDSPYLYGLHDAGGQHVMLDRGVPGWVLLTLAVGQDPNDQGTGDDPCHGDYRTFSDRGLGVIGRLNNGYSGAGTLPVEMHYDDFARRCANFVRVSQGCHVWIVGNEPNHPIEWPGANWDWNAAPQRPRSEATRGEPITPDRYARCYKAVRAAIHGLANHANDQVLVAGPAPWNNLTTYPGNTTGDWVQYFADTVKNIGTGNCDGFALHTYTHGTDPALVTSEARMNPPFQNRHFQFRAYQDFMGVIPAAMQGLPVYITETDQGDDPWRNENSGWVRAAYAEIDAWNRAHSQKIRALLLYRWPQVPGDRWGLDGKQGTIDDFAAALANKYGWDVPVDNSSEMATQVDDLEAQIARLAPAITAAQTLAQQMTTLARAVSDAANKAAALNIAGLKARIGDLTAQLAALEKDIDAAQVVTPPAHGPVEQPPLQDVRDQLPQHATARYPTRSRADIRRIVVHHTVTSSSVQPAVLAQAQVNQGKPGITYHFLINGDGTIYWTQPLETVTDQTLTANVNSDGVAVALAGNFTSVAPTDAQMVSAAALIAWLCSLLGLTTASIAGRSELENVQSPGAQWLSGARYKDTLVAKVQALLDAAQPVDDATVTVLRRQLSELQAQLAACQPQANQAAALQKQVAGLQSTVDQQQADADKLKATVAADEAELARLRDQLRNAGSGTGVRKPDVVDVVDTLPHHPTLRYSKRTQPISTIVVHHTDSPTTATPQSTAEYHVHGVVKDAKGNFIKAEWPGIAYHYVIAADGTIYWCQRHETLSYHCGDANNYCLGVSLIGCFSRINYSGQPQPVALQTPTPAQLTSTSRLVAWLLQELKLPKLEQIKGHKEVNITSCPGDHWTEGANWKATLYNQVRAIQAGGGDGATTNPVNHYLLFWDHGDTWADADWRNAQNYIAHFRPTVGFSVDAALAARHVTIVGGEAGVSGADEARLRAAGVDVHRLAGADEAATRALLDDLAAKNTPWPGAAPGQPPAVAIPTLRAPGAAVAGGGAVHLEPPAVLDGPSLYFTDQWTVPADWTPPAGTDILAQPAGPLRIKVLPLSETGAAAPATRPQ